MSATAEAPAHRELVLAVLDVGKAVYCEAPLGRTVREAEDMVSAVGSLHTAIGLQGRLNPAVRRAAQLVSSGRIGRPLNAQTISQAVGFGPEMPSTPNHHFNNILRCEPPNHHWVGNTDVVEAVLGAITEIDARTEDLWPAVRLTDAGEELA